MKYIWSLRKFECLTSTVFFVFIDFRDMARVKLWNTFLIVFLIYCIIIISIWNFVEAPCTNCPIKADENSNFHHSFYLEVSTDETFAPNKTSQLASKLGLSDLKHGNNHSSTKTDRHISQAKSFIFRNDFTWPGTKDKYAFQLMDYKTPVYAKTRAPCFFMETVSR